MTGRKDPTTRRGRKGALRLPRGAGAYLTREVAELALLVGALATVGSTTHVPTWILVGLPVAKVLASVAFYALFLRRAFRRPAHLGTADLVGRTASAVTPLRPAGQVKVDGEIWSARSIDRRTIARHADVEIVGVRGNTVLVTEPIRGESVAGRVLESERGLLEWRGSNDRLGGDR